MIEKIIQKYISKLTHNDIYNFSKQNDIILDNDELDYIYNIIKTKWKIVVFGNPDEILKEAQSKLSNSTYKKVEELLYIYKNKYKNYL